MISDLNTATTKNTGEMIMNEARLEKLIKGLRAVAGLMAESQGVAGLHLNGDVAAWDELLQNAWLEDYHDAMNELIDMDAEQFERDKNQHEIRMTDDPHYAADHKRKQREEELATHGIDE